jgi:hypothetical protein
MRPLNGDHAQYEVDNVNTPPEQRSDWPMPSFNALDWAKAFSKRFPDVPVDSALPWFAGALMRGYDEHAWRANGPSA